MVFKCKYMTFKLVYLRVIDERKGDSIRNTLATLMLTILSLFHDIRYSTW